jgi:hypothetical protein
VIWGVRTMSSMKPRKNDGVNWLEH